MAINHNNVTDTLIPTTGGLSVTGLIANSMTVATSWSIPSGYSSLTVGPMTINSGITITIPSGSRWVVL
jgi:hypothetical protein